MSETHIHHPGHLKQQNKAHKNKFSSKSEIKKTTKGRVENHRENFRKAAVELNKEERKSRAKQIQKNKRKIVLQEKKLGSKGYPPKIIVLF